MSDARKPTFRFADGAGAHFEPDGTLYIGTNVVKADEATRFSKWLAVALAPEPTRPWCEVCHDTGPTCLTCGRKEGT